MNLIHAPCWPRQSRSGAFVLGLVAIGLASAAAMAQDPIASSNFSGTENPLFENGAWVSMYSMAPQGTQFQKNNGALCNQFTGPDNNHAVARTTAPIPADHYSEIVVGHIGNNSSYVGAYARIQTSGPSIDSGYIWWGSLAGGANNKLYRIDATGTAYKAIGLVDHSPFADGDRIRLIARGPVLYGIKNGVREFIYNTGPDSTNHPGTYGVAQYSGGTAGMLAFVPNFTLTDAVISSWSAGAAPSSSGTWASSTFQGVEDPLDEGDRWYPLPGYSGFKKAGGVAVGKDGGHNASGVWSIAPPSKQYSEVTLGTVASGGGGPIVRIDRTNNAPTGWLLFMWADNPVESGVYKMNTDGSFTRFRQFTPTLVPGDKWRLSADGNDLTVSRNGVVQFTFTTDGSYPAGDVGMEALTPAFTFLAWEGGAVTQPPAITSFSPTSGQVGTSVTISGTAFTGATAVAFNGTPATFTGSSDTAIQATVPVGATSGPVSVTTPGGTATSASPFTVVIPPPTISSFAPASGPVGTNVTINGTNFSGATAVAFNAVSASFTVTSDSTIQATVPAGATTGPLTVTAGGGTAQSASAFRVVGPPQVQTLAPSSGTVGTSVTISGVDLSGATSVTFNGASAAFSVTSDTAILATVPAGATTGPVSVTTPVGTASSATSFVVIVSVNLSATKTGNGAGTVTSTSNRPPMGSSQIDCGTACSSTYEGGTVVTLTAAPATGSDFSGWTGCDSVSGATCTVTMTGNRTVNASFTLQRFALTVNKASLLLGNGTVTSTSNPTSSDQINCGSNCSVLFNYGTVVTLTARPGLLSLFTGWSGCDSASGTTCTVAIKSARSVTANFTP